MNEIIKALYEYVADTECPQKNYNLAKVYKDLKQYAGAVTFYCRASERTDDKNLAYLCLLKQAECFDIQKGRPLTVRGFYKHAICLLPERPEAYFLLSQHYEQIKEYADAYMIAELALNKCDFSIPKLIDDVNYPGEYGLIFQKAVSAWWWGKTKECRQLFGLLADEYRNEMTDNYLTVVQNNLINLGSGPESQAFRNYNKSLHDRLKFKFPGSDKIQNNFSQVYQDMFVLAMLNGKQNGTYLEIGSSKPFFGNNTALLEQQYNWSGVGIEYKLNFVEEYRSHRRNPVICRDATLLDYDKILKEISRDGVVDYLQVDCEPSKTTFEILLGIPFDKYKFAVITYEHDYYVDITRSYREKSRRYLRAMGYELVVNDVSPDGVSTFEDWWVHPELVDKDILMKMIAVNNEIKHIEKYFLN